jgi:CRP-like cAMP-binding protein
MAESRRKEVNRLLAALPREDYARLAPHLERVALDSGLILHHIGQPVDYIYFPETMLVSLLNMLSDGSTIEVAIVGKEGIAGISPLLESERATMQAMVQIPGEALRIRAQVLKAEFGRGTQLQVFLLRYIRSLTAQIAQTAVCNCLHTVEQRLARWLLMSRSRVDSDELPLTQEFIAHMLGTRRAGVSEAASMLQDAGLISYVRGHITIHNLKGLEAASCECYQVVKSLFESMNNEDSGGTSL